MIGDTRFMTLGLREEAGFMGELDRDSRLPLFDYINARAEDLGLLVGGMIAFGCVAGRNMVGQRSAAPNCSAPSRNPRQ